MTWTPAKAVGAFVVVAGTLAVIAYLPSDPAWKLLAVIVEGAAKVVFG